MLQPSMHQKGCCNWRDKSSARAKAFDSLPEMLIIWKMFPGRSGSAWRCFGFRICRGRVVEFLTQFHSKLEKGAVVFLADNINVPGVGGELVATPRCGHLQAPAVKGWFGSSNSEELLCRV